MGPRWRLWSSMITWLVFVIWHSGCDIDKFSYLMSLMSLRWRHNGCDSVSNHQPRECLLRRLIRRTSKKTSKLRVTGLCAGNSPETGEFPAQMASNAENVSIWWRHHVQSKWWSGWGRHYQPPAITLGLSSFSRRNAFAGINCWWTSVHRFPRRSCP